MTKNKTLEEIARIPLFSTLSTEEIKEIQFLLEEVSYSEKKLIYVPNKEASNIYFLKHGKIRIFRLSTNGKEQTIRFVNPGEFTGEIAFFKNQPHFEAYAEAYTESVVWEISRDNFYTILDTYPQIRDKILHVLSTRLSASEKMTSSIATEEVRVRVRQLLRNISELDETGTHFVTLDTAKKDWASLLGTTPESFSRALSALEKEKIIYEERHRIIISDWDALNE